VHKKFGRMVALDSISLSCNKGQTIALIGPNGSGKTTFIKCLLGMVIPDSGFITVNQENISRSWEYRQHIGYMPQISRFPDNMAIEQVIDMVKDIRKKKVQELDEELIANFDLQSMYGKRMRTLSGGTRQKVSACLAFLFNPDILILDEPTAGLDPVSTELLKDKISAERQKNKLILITSHVLSDLDELISDVVYMQEGKPLFHKSLQALKVETDTDRLSAAIARVMAVHELMD